MRRSSTLVLPLAAVLALAAGLPAFAAEGAPVRLPRPPFPPAAADAPVAGAPALSVVESRPNAITDVRAWFRRNRLVPDEWAIEPGGDVPAPALPERFERSYRGLALQRAIRSGDLALLVYGKDGGEGRFLVGSDRRSGEVVWAYDFASYATAPGTPRSELALARQIVEWATVRGDTLYVETAHPTFASSSGGRNAYIAAIDVNTHKLRWRSPALVANAREFAVVDGYVIAGYGFTREPDALYVLDRRNGRAIGRLAVPTAPEHILLRRGSLWVRTYDRDLKVRISRS